MSRRHGDRSPRKVVLGTQTTADPPERGGASVVTDLPRSVWTGIRSGLERPAVRSGALSARGQFVSRRFWRWLLGQTLLATTSHLHHQIRRYRFQERNIRQSQRQEADARL